MSLPLHGARETLLDPEPHDAARGLEEVRAMQAAADADDAEIKARLRALVAAHPTFLAGWAALAKWALRRGDPVAAYAFARTGYHRGLDRIRGAGWGGQGPVPWHHEPNRGFLESVHVLMGAAIEIGERDEAVRCRDFLLELDPADELKVRELTVP
ncbi:MAG: DUF3151 family protein [Nitriliruptorales bacterium]|nr:DUF3151 family protein [Nitriliruptorales bacterium]